MRVLSRQLATVVLLVMVLMAVPLSGCSSDAAVDSGGDSEGEPYRIGAVLSLSGPYAGLGGPEKNALEMEVARINAEGGVNGRPIELVIEDDATDEAKTVSATSKLIEQDEVVAIIGATGTGQSMAMRGDVQRAGIPQVSLGGGTVITADFDPLVFQTPWPNTLTVPKLLGHLEDEGVTKVALISDSGGFGKDGHAVIEDEVADFGIEIVADETFNVGDTDMTAQLTKIKSSDAEAVIMWSAGAEAATVLQNAQQLQMGIPLYGSNGNARKEFIDGAGDAAEGFVFPAGKILLPESYGEGTEGYEVATDFTDRYTEEFGEAPNIFAGHAYDAIHIIASAIESLDDEFTSDELREAIEAVDGLVAIGGTFTFSAEDHNGMTLDDIVLYKIEGGEWTLAE